MQSFLGQETWSKLSMAVQAPHSIFSLPNEVYAQVDQHHAEHIQEAEDVSDLSETEELDAVQCEIMKVAQSEEPQDIACIMSIGNDVQSESQWQPLSC